MNDYVTWEWNEYNCNGQLQNLTISIINGIHETSQYMNILIMDVIHAAYSQELTMDYPAIVTTYQQQFMMID